MKSNSETLPPLIALVGPTAVGKTTLSIELAQRFPFEIISADSRLFYIGMDIGTAKPAEFALNKVPHHLVDVSFPDKPWSLSDFRSAAYAAIDLIHAREKIPLIVGGTGQYISAVLEGWQPPARSATGKFRMDLERYAVREGSAALHARLAQIDPVAADHIDHRNIRRVIRALEICQITGKPASEQRLKQPPPYRILRIGLILPREQLYARIDARVERMLDSGLEGEVRRLLEAGYDFQTPPFSAIGYRQMARVIQGEMALDQAKADIKRLSRQLVRRQANWFKLDDERIHWYENRSPDVIKQIQTLIESWLAEAPSR